MGIYLPNTEMPRNGQMLVIFPDGTSYVCFNGMRERLTQTTAVPVPPHGRLVKASKVEFELCESTMPKKYRDFCRRVINDENLVPTVIPAEEGEA